MFQLCCASMMRTVPVFERITMEWVVARDADAAHAGQHRAVGDAGRGEHHIALGEVEQVVFAVEIGDAPLLGARPFSSSLRNTQAALHLAADAAQGGRRQHTFRVRRPGPYTCRRRCRACAVAITPETSPSEISMMRAPVRAHLGDKLGVARPVEDAGHQIADIHLLGLGEVLQVFGGLAIEIDHAFGQDRGRR